MDERKKPTQCKHPGCTRSAQKCGLCHDHWQQVWMYHLIATRGEELLTGSLTLNASAQEGK